MLGDFILNRLDNFMIVKDKIIGHRGASMYAPENSASSLKLASLMGIEWIETDVQITLDNKLVISFSLAPSNTGVANGIPSLRLFANSSTSSSFIF